MCTTIRDPMLTVLDDTGLQRLLFCLRGRFSCGDWCARLAFCSRAIGHATTSNLLWMNYAVLPVRSERTTPCTEAAGTLHATACGPIRPASNAILAHLQFSTCASGTSPAYERLCQSHLVVTTLSGAQHSQSSLVSRLIVCTAMLFLRLPGYFSQGSKSSFCRAAAALQSTIDAKSYKVAMPCCGGAQQLTRLSDLATSVREATNNAAGSSVGVDTATIRAGSNRGFAALASQDAAAAEIFDRQAVRA